MSFRAERLPAGAEVQVFDWNGTWSLDDAPAASGVLESLPPASPPPPIIDAAAIDREAFNRGYAEGERAAADAAAARSEHVLRRLASAVEELNALRAGVLQRTEREIVQLSLAIARRIVHREITLDRELIATMARVAIDRLGRPASARVHLHPDDHAALSNGRVHAVSIAPQLVADSSVSRGGCLVRSDLGEIDLNVDAQIAEVEAALLGTPATSDAPIAESACAA
jgi:flagellar assembly protein FliH